MRTSAIPDRLAALTGVAFVGLVATGMLLGDPYDPLADPHPGRPAQALASALVRNREQARLGAYLLLAGVFFLFWFLAYLYARLREAEQERGWIAVVALGGGLVAGSVLLLNASMAFAASELSDYGADAQVAKTFFVWGWNAANVAAPPLIAVVAATTLVALRYHIFPRWFRLFGVAWTVVLVFFLFSNMAGMGAGLSLLWVLVASFVLFFEAAAFVQPGPPDGTDTVGRR